MRFTVGQVVKKEEKEMKIKYVHFENPEKEKEVDFGLLYQNHYLPFHRAFFPDKEAIPQEKWEKEALERLKK